MRKILLPYDGSKPSLRAFEHIAARARRGEKVFVDILFVQPFVLPVEFVSWDAVESWLEQEKKRVLTNSGFVKLTREVENKIHVVTGDPVEQIVKAARKRHSREIVMGTRGMNRLKGFVMGSVATKVVQLSPLPVTLIK